MVSIIKYCNVFLSLLKLAEEDLFPKFPITRRVQYAVEAYKKHFKLDLIPGPVGSMGQVFFAKDNPDVIIKFTTDTAEAKNMLLVYKIQNNEFIPDGMSSKEISLIKNGVIKIYNVFAFAFGRGKINIIEQERGQDLPYSLSTKLMEIIGGNISKQPDAIFNIIQKNLSDSNKIQELSDILAQHLIDKGKITINQSADVNVGDLGNLLKAVRSKIDSSFRDFRPSNMLVVRDGNKYKIKLIDLGYGSGANIQIPTISI